MQSAKKIYGLAMIFLTLGISIMVMIAPTFFSQNTSRISINKEIDLALLLNGSKDVELVFFGYTGCSSICTPRLQQLATFYNSLEPKLQKRLDVVFLDISNPADKTMPQSFAQHFHKDFKGIYLEKETMRQYTKEFNVYFAQSILDSSEFDHTANLYLLVRKDAKKELRYIYNTYPFDFTQISDDIKEILNADT